MSTAPTPRPVRAVLIGASGRMGRSLLTLVPQFADLSFVAAIASRESAALGRDAGVSAGLAPTHVPITSDLSQVLPRADVVIDFSDPRTLRANLAACRAAGKALLIGTTGYGPELEADFAAAGTRIALLIAPNTSLGVTLLLELARLSAGALAGFDAGIAEIHHQDKRDAPSGTALALAAAIREARPGPHGPGRPAQVPISSVREAQVIGEHAVRFAAPGEELLLTHRALDRGIFARGALLGALWLAAQPPGRYSMRDVLLGKTGT